MTEESGRHQAASNEPEKKAVESRGPRSVLPRFEQEIERLFGGGLPWRMDWPGLRTGFSHTPKVDVLDHEGEVVVRAELPGFKREEIEVTLAERSITIAATNSSESSTDDDADYYHREIRRDYVARTVGLPSAVSGDDVTATFKDGMLEVTMPKVQAAKRKSIEIR